jgi:hypothetical protein
VLAATNSTHEFRVRLLSTPATPETKVNVINSDPASVVVQDAVVLVGEKEVILTVNTAGTAGQATVTLQSGADLRQVAIFVGPPWPLDKMPLFLSLPVGVKVLEPPSAGQAIVSKDNVLTITLPFLSTPATEDLAVTVQNSNPAVLSVEEPVFVWQGDREVTLALTTPDTNGEAVLTLKAGADVRRVHVFVGPPWTADKIPLIVAPMVGVEVEEE